MSRSVEKYGILLIPEIEAKQKGSIGQVIHEEDREFRVPIILDDETVSGNRYRNLMTYQEDNKYYIYVTQDFYKIIMSEKNYALVGIWHEIGHIHFNHYFKDDEEGRQYRRDCALNNRLNKYEAEADSFAVKAVSKSAVIAFLDILIKHRKELNDDYSSVSINEMNLRKKAVQRMQ